MTHVLFLSEKCTFCRKLIDQIKTNEDVINEFQIVNIHQIPKIPVYVKAVPSILVNRNDIITGKEVFEFVEKLLNPPNLDPNAFEFQETNPFSFIESDGLVESQKTFTYIDNAYNDEPLIPEYTSTALEESKGSPNNIMEQLLEQRRNEIPDFIKRT